MLDGELMEEAVKVLGVKTYSAAANQALAEAVRAKKIQSSRGFGRLGDQVTDVFSNLSPADR